MRERGGREREGEREREREEKAEEIKKKNDPKEKEIHSRVGLPFFLLLFAAISCVTVLLFRELRRNLTFENSQSRLEGVD